MAAPGEVNQELGRAYQYVFIGALESNIRYFENKFNVHTEPQKTSFQNRAGKGYSFDFNGVFNAPWDRAEVFGECKGYTKGGGLLGEFKAFLAKAYITTTDYDRHQKDYFWFVTNVPFACTEGSGIRSYEFVHNTLNNKANSEVTEILGKGHVDDNFVRNLVRRLGIFILTDSYLMNTELSYKVLSGESMWTILKKFHAGRLPTPFRENASQIAAKNNLSSPDLIISGRRIRFPWYGMKRRGEYESF